MEQQLALLSGTMNANMGQMSKGFSGLNKGLSEVSSKLDQMLELSESLSRLNSGVYA